MSGGASPGCRWRMTPDRLAAEVMVSPLGSENQSTRYFPAAGPRHGNVTRRYSRPGPVSTRRPRVLHCPYHPRTRTRAMTTKRHKLRIEALEDRLTPAAIYATAPDPGSPPAVTV